jgi:hypothetical protein
MHHGFLYDQVKLYLPLKMQPYIFSNVVFRNYKFSSWAARKALKATLWVLLEELILQYSLGFLIRIFLRLI